jgi:hypothetical protein
MNKLHTALQQCNQLAALGLVCSNKMTKTMLQQEASMDGHLNQSSQMAEFSQLPN